jgi:hypothetical protein
MSMYFYVEKSFGGRKRICSRYFCELFTWSAPYTLLWLHGKQKGIYILSTLFTTKSSCCLLAVKLRYSFLSFLRFKKEGNIWVEDRERSVLQAVAASGPFIQ